MDSDEKYLHLAVLPFMTIYQLGRQARQGVFFTTLR